MGRQPKAPTGVAGWIVFCAFCNCAGWILSACHQLNRNGYAVALVLGVTGYLVWRGRQDSRPTKFSTRLRSASARQAKFPTKFAIRFRHWLPRSFLFIAFLAIAGGLLYPPTNYDGLAYRTPRVLHWLAAGQWHWIHTAFNRLNTRAPGFEWICAPLICLTGTDRFLFLIESISFCLLPGLVFSSFRRLGVKGRVAWQWMWLGPTGYCFVLQAGAISNDLAGAVFALAALDFALRARVSRRAADLWLAMLAAALMTGIKAVSLPLLLPIAVAMWPVLPALRRRVPATAGIVLIGALASFLPSAVLNMRYCGDWSGLKAEHNEFQLGKPLLRLANNSVVMMIENCTPPIFPFAGAWNRTIERLMPPSWRSALEEAFEPPAAHWDAKDMVIEEDAALGLGVIALLVVSLVAGLLLARRNSTSGSKLQESVSAGPAASSPWLVLGSVWLALLILMAKSGVSGLGRLSSPYYMLLAPSFLLGQCQGQVVRAKWWKGATAFVLAMAGLLVVLCPSRPLWPASRALARFSNIPSVAHAKLVYELHAKRADALAPARDLLPPGVKVLGLVAFDDLETSLWRPFGSRRVQHLTPEDTVTSCRERGIPYVLIHRAMFAMIFQEPLDGWIRRMDGEIVGKVKLKLKGTLEADDWILVKLPS